MVMSLFSTRTWSFARKFNSLASLVHSRKAIFLFKRKWIFPVTFLLVCIKYTLQFGTLTLDKLLAYELKLSLNLHHRL